MNLKNVLLTWTLHGNSKVGDYALNDASLNEKTDSDDGGGGGGGDYDDDVWGFIS
jgi:hypothetical protein